MRTPCKLLICTLILLLSLACVLPFAATSTPPPPVITYVFPTPPPQTATGVPQATLPVGPTIIVPTLPPAAATPTPVIKLLPQRFAQSAGSMQFNLVAAAGNPPELRRVVWILPTGYEMMTDCSMHSGLGFVDNPPTDVTIPGEMYAGTVFASCGWQQNEVVTVVLLHPDGTSETSTVIADKDFGASAFFQFGYNTHLGQHTLILSGTSGSFEHSFTIHAPVTPGMVYANGYDAYFYNLVPGERVVVGAYIADTNGGFLRLAGWGVFATDTNGQLYVRNNTSGTNLVGLADLSGTLYAQWLLDMNMPNARAFQVPNCTGAPASRLANSGLARVTLTGGANNLRAQPGTNQSLVGRIQPGGEMVITHEQPVCAGGMLWWNVWARDGSGAGWTSEGQGSDYWLEPVD